jgi:hypothetical protein
MSRYIAPLIVIILFYATSGYAAFLEGSSSPQNSETITANLVSLSSYTIPSNFNGISEEFTDVVHQAGFTYNYPFPLFNASNTSLQGLLKLLGPSGFIRAGGSSQDFNPPPVLTTAIANGINAFFTGLGPGWTINYGLDFANGTPSLATSYVGIMLGAMTNSAPTFSIGNEPDQPPYSYNSSTYATAWNSWYSTITAAYPSAAFVSADTANPDSYTWAAGTTPGVSGLQFVTVHAENGGMIPPSQLSSMISNAQSTNFYYFATYATNYKARVNETNSSYYFGTPSPSNGLSFDLANAAWYLNVAMNFASFGGGGISVYQNITSGNSGGGPPCVGNVFFYDNGTGNFYPGSIFYGMMLFSNIEGQQIVSTSYSGSGNVNAISTKNGTGNASILVVNDDVNNPVKIIPAQSNAWSKASVLLLAPGSAAGCIDYSPTIGGYPVGESGSWAGKWFSLSNGGSVNLAPCGAAVIEIQS